MRLPRPLPALITAIIVAGCRTSDSTSPKASITGTWVVQTVNGAALPYLEQQQGANKTEWIADSTTLTSDRLFTRVSEVRYTMNGVVTSQSLHYDGGYTLTGTVIDFSYSYGASATGSWDGSNAITITNNGLVIVFRRQ